MNWAALAALLVLLALPVLAVRATIGAGLRRRAGDRPVPGVEDTGLVGWHKPPAAGASPRPLPGPGEHLGHGRRLLTVRFYEDGAACIWDATGRHAATFGSAADLGWDEWLKGLTK